ncbi:hypothetical protein [Streptomyces rimosus]|uniref:hypothetical protein n=1 Tax=Streptomyces rimosus TaxID=1927 RepID=UPI0004C76FE5|nr:hypothetical protein [Streptomyces rimosus]
MDDLQRASWASAAVQIGAKEADYWRDLQEQGPEAVARRRRDAEQQARQYSPYSPARLTLARLSYVLVLGMFAFGFIGALAGGGEEGSGARVVMMIGVYTALAASPLYLVVSLRTGRLIARAMALTMLEDPAARSQSAAEYVARSMSQPLYAAWGTVGCLATGFVPWPRLHTGMYQGALADALYRGLDISSVTAGR